MKLRNVMAVVCTSGLAAGTALSATTASAIPAAPHGPKNVIVLIGDGMGYTHMNNASLYENGVAYKQVSGTPGNVQEIQGTPSYTYQDFPVQVDMTTYWAEGSYDPMKAWTDFDYVKDNPTDSAAAGTAMATGVKTYNALENGEHGWTLVDEKADFESLTTGETPDRVFGIAQVGSTLQQGRAGKSVEPYDVAFNEGVPSLETMTEGALNVLDNNDEGFSLMVEGGAIDWAGHANDSARDIEEVMEFNKAVDAVVDWVEENSSWRETLVIVTADHETGYLEGADSNPNWSELTGGNGSVPGLTWNSGNHTNQLVPVYAKGAGAKELARLATGEDPVRGEYLDNTDLANVLLEDLWAENNKGKAKGRYNGNDKQGNAKNR